MAIQSLTNEVTGLHWEKCGVFSYMVVLEDFKLRFVILSYGSGWHRRGLKVLNDGEVFAEFATQSLLGYEDCWQQFMDVL